MTDQPFDAEFDEVERYEFREAKPYVFQADRREFVQTLGAGIMVAVVASRSQGQRPVARRDEPLSARFHIGEDGIIVVLTSKVEVGQGSRTQLSQAAAEEFRVPIERIRLIMADTEQCPDDGGTAGSRTTPSTVPRVRNAAAAARRVLTNIAASRLGVAVEQIRLADGVFHTDAGKRVALTDLAQDKVAVESLQVAAPADGVNVTRVSEWTVLGTSAKKAGARAMVTGEHRFPSDIVRPDMLYGKVLRPNAFGATLSSIDLKPAEAMEDVTVVRDGEFVGCVASTSWQAQKARDAIAATAKWQPSVQEQISSKNLFVHLKSSAREVTGGRSRTKSWGNVSQALRDAAKTITSQYTVAYVQHAPMEPRGRCRMGGRKTYCLDWDAAAVSRAPPALRDISPAR